MFLNNYITESEDNVDDVDILVDQDPDTEEGIEAMAREVEGHMTAAALEAVTYFDGGEEAVKTFSESAEVQAMIESRRMAKRTFVRLSRNDDLQRRINLASLVLAKKNNDSLWRKLADNRVKERKLRSAIFKKYYNKAIMIAKKSQQVHIKNSKNLPSLPKIQF